MPRFTRRDFLKTTVGTAGAMVGIPGVLAAATTRSATDWVPLGDSGVDVTRLAMGSGTHNGNEQRRLGQAAFTRVVRHAYDRGVRFFESADAYRTHGMVAEALKGIPRDSYRLMTKLRGFRADDVPGTIDRFRKELNTDYLDVVLLHCMTRPNWSQDLEPLRDALAEAKAKQIIRAHGASCHGLPALTQFPGNDWLDVSLNRVNHNGTRMDGPLGRENEVGDVPKVVSELEKIHAQGTGVIGMKIIGEGAFQDPEVRDASFKFVMNLDCVDAVTIAMLSEAHVDEAIERMNRHLNG
jgi:predicted aldo/keto reductase-like oxidoreductase